MLTTEQRHTLRTLAADTIGLAESESAAIHAALATIDQQADELRLLRKLALERDGFRAALKHEWRERYGGNGND